MLNMNVGLRAKVTDTAAANKICQVVLATPAKPNRWSIGGIAWSYEGSASLDSSAGIDIHVVTSDTSGGLSVTDTSGTLVLSIDINDDGAGFIIPAEPFKFPPGLGIRINMGDGGSVSKLNILGAKLV